MGGLIRGCSLLGVVVIGLYLSQEVMCQESVIWWSACSEVEVSALLVIGGAGSPAGANSVREVRLAFMGNCLLVLTVMHVRVGIDFSFGLAGPFLV